MLRSSVRRYGGKALGNNSPVAPLVEHDFFGLRLHSLDRQHLEGLYTDCNDRSVTRVFYGYSLTVIPKIRDFPELFTLSNTFDVLTADGKGLYAFARLFGIKLSEHVSIPDMTELAIDYCARTGRTLLLFGASEAVNRKACEHVSRRYPGVRSIRGINGYFSPDEEGQVLAKVAEARPDVLLIGISSPMKERLASRLRDILHGTVIIPCGGMIDVLAGAAKREPLWVKKASLAWLYRFVQEPRRLFRAVLLNGLYFACVLAPVCLVKRYLLRDKDFTFYAWFHGNVISLGR